jgi:hypothetical protein
VSGAGTGEGQRGRRKKEEPRTIQCPYTRNRKNNLDKIERKILFIKRNNTKGGLQRPKKLYIMPIFVPYRRTEVPAVGKVVQPRLRAVFAEIPFGGSKTDRGL